MQSLTSSDAYVHAPFRANGRHRLCFALGLLGCLVMSGQAGEPATPPDRIPTSAGELVVQPINHATLMLQWNGKTILVDPVGGAPRFASLPKPDLVLLTDVHGDHLHGPTLEAIATDQTLLVAPAAVKEKLPAKLLPRTTSLANGASATVAGIAIDAVAAYNLSPERMNFHAKGRGNGYVLSLGGKRIYLSGDTEDIPEMRALKNIDVAFVCMNLPYTMDVDQAAKAVAGFRPKIVYPYHCRGSDLVKFQQLLADTPGVEVRVRDWYR